MLPDPQRAPTLGVQEVSYSLAIDLHIAHLSGNSRQKVREPLVMPLEELALSSPGQDKVNCNSDIPSVVLRLNTLAQCFSLQPGEVSLITSMP